MCSLGHLLLLLFYPTLHAQRVSRVHQPSRAYSSFKHFDALFGDLAFTGIDAIRIAGAFCPLIMLAALVICFGLITCPEMANGGLFHFYGAYGL